MTALMPESNAVGAAPSKAGWLRRLKDCLKDWGPALRERRQACHIERLSDHLMRDIGLLRRPR